MKKLIISLCLNLSIVLFIIAHGAIAAVPGSRDERPQSNLLPEQSSSQTQQPTISRRQASDLARDRFDGRVLSVRMDNNNWRVRMDSEGTVFNVFVNASSGAVSRPSN